MAAASCRPEPLPEPEDQPYVLVIPKGFPMMVIPPDNELTQFRVELGKQLFYDSALSRDYSLSCASCHLAEAGFADHHPLSVGIEGKTGVRNSPTLTNIGYHPHFFREGGSPSLEQQALGPIENQNEMGFNGALLTERLAASSHYQEWAQKAYGRDLDLFVITRALASFERTLISGNAPYDRFRRNEDPRAMSPEAIAGMNLFFSDRTHCAQCHSGFDLSSHTFENNGLTTQFQEMDMGRYRVTLDSADIGKLTVPTLRNVALTAPYMVDGRIPDLAGVIEHYNQGGKGHLNQSPFVTPLGLNETEKQALVAFLEALTDTSFIRNPAFLPDTK